jgi:hypothetical protein
MRGGAEVLFIEAVPLSSAVSVFTAFTAVAMWGKTLTSFRKLVPKKN